MKRTFYVVVLCILIASLSWAQDKQPEWTIEKTSSSLGNDVSGLFAGHGGGQGGYAKWPIANRTVEQVWKAVMQNLMLMKGTTAEGDLPSGTITAKRPGALIRFIITSSSTGTDLFGKWEFVPGEKMQFSTPFSQTKKFFNELFPKVKETLKLARLYGS